jgi:hypothetical protein
VKLVPLSTHLHAAALVVCCCALVAGLPQSALAVAPPNDARTAPQELGSLPALARGTTAEATLEEDEPGSACGPIKNSVWFSFTAPSSRELLVALDAAGDLAEEPNVAPSEPCARGFRWPCPWR